MKEELTKWFPADVTPVHRGVYEILVHSCFGRGYRFWDGVYWHAAALDFFSEAGENTRQRAADRVEKIYQMTDKWRGLVKPYKGWKL